MPETYVCESCHGLFPLIRDQGDEANEYQTLFPDEQHEEKVRLCEPCFIKLMEKAEAAGVLSIAGWRKCLDKQSYPD